MSTASDTGPEEQPIGGGLAADDLARLAVADGSFVSRARKRKVFPPTARDFDPAAWTADYHAHRRDERDDRLHAAGLWFGQALGRCWLALVPFRFETLPVDPVTRQLAGIANLTQLMTEAKLLEASLDRRSGDLPTGSAAHLKLAIGQGMATADMVRTSVLDTLGTIARLVRSDVAEGSGRGRFDPRLFLTSIPIFEDIYLLEYAWARVLWLDWSLETEGADIQLRGGIHDAAEVSVTVSSWRRQELFAEFDAVFLREWNEPDSVIPPVWSVTARKHDSGFRFKAERQPPDKSRISTIYLMREMLSDTELAPFLHTPLPKLTDGLTLDDLLSAWELLALAARAIEGKLFEGGPNQSISKLGPAVRLDDLDALLSVLDWPEGKRRAALGFFTFEDSSQDGLWARPLLPIGKGRVVPVLTPLVVPNLYRTAELWMTEGAGENIFRDRGASFEGKLRDTIVKGLVDRPWRDRVSVLRESWEPKIDGTKRDIDLLFRIDNLVLVGELKLKKFPAAAAEIGRHVEEFAHAAGQLDIRLSWLAAHKAEIARRTGFAGAPEELQLHGMVISGTQFGSGCTVSGHPVIDSEALTFFFQWSQFVVAADVDRSAGYAPVARKPGRAVDLVDGDVAASFLAYLADPWPVRYAELGIMRETRTAVLKSSDQTLSWPDHHLDGDVFTEQTVDALIAAFRARTEQWRERARHRIAAAASADG